METSLQACIALYEGTDVGKRDIEVETFWNEIPVDWMRVLKKESHPCSKSV